MIRLPESELEVMMCIWRSEQEELSVNFILEGINHDRKITAGALHSYLNRLEEKGFIRCEKRGKLKMVTPLISEAEYREIESENMLNKFFHGSVSSLVSCLYKKDKLNIDDIRELKEFVNQFEDNEE